MYHTAFDFYSTIGNVKMIVRVWGKQDVASKLVLEVRVTHETQ